MTQHHISSHTLKRLGLVLLTLMLAICPAAAQSAWAPADAAKPLGKGTSAEPYLIATANNLYWLSLNVVAEGSANKYYALTSDIDLGGREWMPIGNNIAGGFFGHFDGRGHKIKGLRVDWGDNALSITDKTTGTVGKTASSNLGFGLFGYFGGEIKNLVIEEPVFYQSVPTKNIKNSDDVRLGILAGSVGSNNASKDIIIQNVMIRGGKVIDAGDNTYKFYAQAMMIGGLIGDLHGAGYSSTSVSNGAYTIDKIYCDVDFLIPNVELDPTRNFSGSNLKGHQFYVGGLIGRARTIKTTQMPTHSIYSGTVNAPVALVGPVFGAARYNSSVINTFDGIVIAYAGDFYDKASGSTTNATHFANAWYHDFHIYNYTDNSTYTNELVTDVNPQNVNANETRTFTAQDYADFNPFGLAKITPKNMAQFRGVNRGTYLSDTQFATEMGATTSSDYIWSISSGNWDIERIVPITITIAPPSGLTYTATFNTTRPATTGYNVKWYQIAADGTISLVDGSTLTGNTSTIDFIADGAGAKLMAILYDGNKALESATIDADFCVSLEMICQYVAPNTKYTLTLKLADGSVLSPANYTTSYRLTNSKGVDVTATSAVQKVIDGDNVIYTVTDAASDLRTFTGIVTSINDTPSHLSRSHLVYDGLKVQVVEEGGIYTATMVVPEEFASEFDLSTGSWQWYGVNGEIQDDISKYYPLDGKTTNTLVVDKTNNNYTAYCVTFTLNGYSYVAYGTKKDIVYVYNQDYTSAYSASHDNRFAAMIATYPDGKDGNDGRTPATAVRTMTRAYELLSDINSAADNVIVIMGHMRDYEMFKIYDNEFMPHKEFMKNATITGNYGDVNVTGVLQLGRLGSNERFLGLGGATIFKDINLSGMDTDGPSELMLYCNLNDLTFGNGVKMEDYLTTAANHNGLGDYTSPSITIVGGFHNYNNNYFTYPAGNHENDSQTLIFQSGCFGRIIASGRNNYSPGATVAYNPLSHNVFGNPDWPHRVNVMVAIKHSSENEAAKNEYYPDKTYSYDIGLLVGGQTDGTVFVDAKLDMVSGSVGRFISGNISYGRPIPDGYPDDAFFGSAELTLEGGEIGELVGGTLGRYDSTMPAEGLCEAYFYGRSILNIEGGVIHGNIYGAGAGGVVGVGNDTYHTNDECIPYYTGVTTPIPGAKDASTYREVFYGNYDTVKGKVPKIQLRSIDPNLEEDAYGNRNTLDLNASYCEVNIHGGTIKGNVYGGGYGYSKQVTVSHALSQAGDIFGNTYVNITGGTIEGSVYGGGAGSSIYEKGKGALTTDFSRLACVYGDTHVTISGGTIEGRVYGGSEGVEKFPNMATVYGNTHLNVFDVTSADNTVRRPVINDFTFGGSKLGRIEGDTNINIEGGIFGNSIYGGSEGIDDEAQTDPTKRRTTTAIITGSTNVTVTGGQFFTETQHLLISEARRLTPANRMFNIYGGGYMNCVVVTDANVTIKKSLFASRLNLLEKRSFQDCFNDDTYRKFSVYGAGRGILTDVVGNTSVNIEITGGASVPSTVPVDVANNQQFFMIVGGGYAGNVYGNTNVSLKGNIFAQRIYGGGMYGRIEGSANMKVLGGSYNYVYGGGLLGDIQMGTNLEFGNKGNTPAVAAANRNLYVYRDIYGGNDVGGVVGYTRADVEWHDTDGTTTFPVRVYNPTTHTESNYAYTRHVCSMDHGVNLKIYGGTILHDVYGAGNGNHTGYYVPNYATSEHYTPSDNFVRMKYSEGPAYLYRVNRFDPNSNTKNLYRNDTNKNLYGLYLYRPRTGRVQMHIGGNNATDRVNIVGSVYGGGHACTIGAFDPTKDMRLDPSRFIGGGSLKVNFGSHVTVGKAVYMGNRGEIIGKQTVISDDPKDYESTINSDYDYHYFDTSKGMYQLGFPNSVEGRNRFHAYIKLIDMEATTQLTFFNDPGDDPQYRPTLFNASDLRWGSFFAGGARGSMTHNNTDPDNPCYEYWLPKGLTVQKYVVGGSEDAQVKFYKYAPDFKSFDTTQPMYTYYGGIVYDTNVPDNTEGLTDDDPAFSYGHYGGGQVEWHSAPAGTADRELKVGDETPRGSRIVMRLMVHCDFDPVKVERAYNKDWDLYKDLPEYGGEKPYDEADDIYYGGIVFGGCFNSGITNGSVQLVCSDNMLGSYFESKDYHDYLAWSTLRRNVGRIFGGGYGAEAVVNGNTYVRLTDALRCFNVFGGGMLGNVTGGTHIEVSGLSKVYNAIYGGGMRANVGKNPSEYHPNTDGDLYASGTHIRLISGGIDRVYGGAFLGDVYGGTHVMASDEDQPEGTRRLLIGHIFGGNDVSGNVYPDLNPTSESLGLNTDIYVSEEPRADKKSYTLSHASADDPNKYYGGFPLIGSIYGAGNGNMADYIPGVTIDRTKHEYSSGRIHIASSDNADYDTWNLGNMRQPDGTRAPAHLPDLDAARIVIKGGTIVNVYGGGNMCTTKESNIVHVEYADTVARAAVPTNNQDPLTWGTLRLFEDLQQAEVTTEIGADTRFSYQIYRVFGGNNHMDMDIQPTWELKSGNVFSVYSGGNFGRMTYPDGLQLTLDSPGMRIASVYGGGRVGDISALDATGAPIVFASDKYGATLNIRAGIIGDVYGGNNVAGNVYNGTNVNITGAISGNVYGSGNGNYIYLYDFDNSRGDPYNPGMITEGYDAHYGGRYFVLPKKIAYGSTYYGNSDEEKILAINSYRPNVEKAFLNIQGTEDNKVFVLGSVYCGGNSSTVLFNPALPEGGNIRFKIGDYVALGGVFLGSNGEGLANPFNISWLANLNDLSPLKNDNLIASRPGFGDKSLLHYNDQISFDTALYPNLLSLYMRAAEVTALPTEFSLPSEGAKSVYIGNFTLGGNRGSMMTDKTIDIEIPESVIIFGRIVGGCYNARVDYEGATALGGMTHPLADGLTDKVRLKVRSSFRPWRMHYNNDTHTVSMVNDRTDFDGNLVLDADVDDKTTYYYSADKCTIYGGCYTSGRTLGNIKIDLYSDVLGVYENGNQYDNAGNTRLWKTVNRDYLMNNVALRRTVFALVGGGYGPLTEVDGDIRLRLMPTEKGIPAAPAPPRVSARASMDYHPTIGTIFGGAHNGIHVGTSTTEVRDGMVFSSLYGGSRSAFKYGSSEVIIGYPKYYVCNTSGEYTLDRADTYSYVAQAYAGSGSLSVPQPEGAPKVYNAKNHDKTEVIKHKVKYFKGDIVAANVYDQINDADKASKFDVKYDQPDDAMYDSDWDRISINIGDNRGFNDLTAPYYGGGGVYGGGHAINAAAMTLSGVNTQLAYDADNNPDNDTTSPTVGYGGNSTIIVGDNDANSAVDADGEMLYATTGPKGEAIRDHVSIGTGHFVPVKVPANGDKMGRYIKDTSTGTTRFVHQESGSPDPDETYYIMETEGGIYGDGRRTFVQNFRAVDISNYGYADYTPQYPKLINTFQRIDLLTLSDCCMQVQGASDYATNSIDATSYSIARVGEIRLYSKLTGDLTPSIPDASIAGNMSLDYKRVRNYLAFFKNVRYIGAIYSNTDFNTDFHGPDGKRDENSTYYATKKKYIADYENPATKDELTFKKRNLATAPNMIGINNGYTLKVQNVFTTDGGTSSGMLENVATDNIYYGPILGVVEVKLLTNAADEGGGYIYAFNKHEESPTTFLERTGNFVYPAAVDNESDNFIVDDCYPLGYYSGPSHATGEEIHYWYVQGHHYFFNATLTAYTYNEDIDFHLNNSDNLILLSGIIPEKKETIKIESIIWEEHLEGENDCALTHNLNDDGTDSRANYEMYLTIDSHTSNDYNLNYDSELGYTNVGNAYVARIPNGNGTTAYGTGADGKIQTHSNYSGANNSPLVGIRLRDTDHGNQIPEFFHKHLEDPHPVTIKITAEDAEGKTNYYTLNINVVYLQGPYISGHVNIENCALPGEYIYANTSDVIAEMDDNLTVTAKKWYLYPKIKVDPTKDIYSWDTQDGKVDVSGYLMDNIAGDVNRIELPARFYQNDWKLGYCVIVNGQPFNLEEPDDDSNRLTVHNYHRMSTVARAIKDMKRPANPAVAGDAGGHITNYGYDLDLDLVGGALVYIEDDKDFELFTKYVNYCNQFRTEISDDEKVSGYEYEKRADGYIYQIENYGQPNEHAARLLNAEVLPGFNKNGYITGFRNGNTILGYDDDEDVHNTNIKNPSGAQNIRFVLSADVTATKDCMVITEFRGRLNGRGHVIYFGDAYEGTNFIDRNYGSIHEVGFVSVGGAETPTATTYTSCIGENRGSVHNSYYYNYIDGHLGEESDFSGDATHLYATLVGKNEKNEDPTVDQLYEGITDNCYQNTNRANADQLAGVRYRYTESFHNGTVAFNLNQEYLKVRYRACDDDALVQETMELPYFDATGRYVGGDYLYAFYADGDYRYAFTRSAEHPEGIRLNENFGNPNYENGLGNGQSMHISDEAQAHDATRYFTLNRSDIMERDEHGNIQYDSDGKPKTGHKGYFPIYHYDATPEHNLIPYSDFIFFGQRLCDGSERDYYPKHITYDNRVYRATGTYGSRADYGFHFNREAYALSPTLTAIDFTGTPDQREASGSRAGLRTYAEGWNYYKYDNHTGEAETAYTQSDDRYSTAEIIDIRETEGLMQLIFYPPVLNLPGGDDSQYVKNLHSFGIKSNTATDDYTHITKNLLVYAPAIDPGLGSHIISQDKSDALFSSLHYTRMQNWGDVLGETPPSDIIGHHLILNKDTGHFMAANGLFHLVDAQNFNAPIDFYVGSEPGSDLTTGRAWMLREPQGYSSRGVKTDANGFTISKDAWECIALPYTCNRVWAVNKGDYIEKYSRGQITHFYGSDPDLGITHHDYWLRGLVGTAKDTYDHDDVVAAADFARPGDGLFEVRGDGGSDEQIRGDYTYYNDWFYTSYKDLAYNEHHNEYGEPMTFKDYCYLTKNAPYIVAFPGPDYYEFDLSGSFYNTVHSTTGCHKQEIMYEFTADEIDPNFPTTAMNLRITVTDIYDAVRHTEVKGSDGTATAHHATFSRLTGTDIQDNMYVLNDGVYTVNVKGSDVVLPAGSAFINCKDFDITEILPFRTYLTVDLPPSKGPRFVAIGNSLGSVEEEVETPQEPADELEPGIEIWSHDSTLKVRSTFATELDIYNMQGQVIRRIHVLEGVNSYTGLPHGFYITHGKKFVIK